MARIETDDDIEVSISEEVVSHAEMRAMLWGRQRESTTTSNEELSPDTRDDEENDENIIGTSNRNGQKRKLPRPTSLSDEWKELTRIKQSESRESIPQLRMHSKKSIWKNFISLCAGLMLAFTSFLPLRNIQTSLLYKDHLGYISLAMVYFSFMIGCIVAPWIVQNAKPKGLLLLAMSSHVFYVAANLLPSFFTLLPASALFGFLQAPLWSVQELLIGSYGTSYSTIAGIRIEKSIRQFQSVFLVFCHTAQILGNLLESGILNLDPRNRITKSEEPMNVNSTTHVCVNSTSCHNIVHVPSVRFGYQISRKVTTVEHVSMDYLQVLLFVYLGLACLSLTLIGFCLKKPDIILNKRKASLREKVFEIWEFMKTKTFMFTVMLMVFTGMQQALVIGDVTKIYGTETLGLGMVGYTMMCYGTAQLAMLLIIEKIQRKFKLIVFILIGFFVTQGLSYLLITWGPNSDSVYSVLGFLAAWGAVDAIWQSQVQGILVSSAMKKEPAVVCFRVCQGIGLSVIFLSSIWLTLLYKVFIVGATLLIGVIGYMVMEVTNNPVTPLEPRPFSV